MNDNNMVRKSNYLIEAQYELNLNEQRLILYACTKIIDENDCFVRFGKNELAQMFGYKDAKEMGYTNIRNALTLLRKRDIKMIRSLNDDTKSELDVGWISSAEYGKDWIELEFSKKIIPYLLQLKNCTEYDLKNVIFFKKKFSIRLYEQFKRWLKEDTGDGFFIIEWEKLNCILESNYKEFKGFNKYVVKDNVEEVNETSDLNVIYRPKKKGRSYKYCTFKITQKTEIVDKKDSSYLKYKEDLEYIMAVIINSKGFSISEFNILKLLKMGFPKEDIIKTYYISYNKEHIFDRMSWITAALKDSWFLETGKPHEEIYKDLQLYKYILENKNKNVENL